jgi:hypothetical protein
VPKPSKAVALDCKALVLITSKVIPPMCKRKAVVTLKKGDNISVSRLVNCIFINHKIQILS